MKNGGRNGMKNGGRKCIRNGVLKRRVGFAVSDTLSTPTGGQKNWEKIEPQNGENFGTKTGKFFVPASLARTRLHVRACRIQVGSDYIYCIASKLKIDWKTFESQAQAQA